jgi:hypothetical protein
MRRCRRRKAQPMPALPIPALPERSRRLVVPVLRFPRPTIGSNSRCSSIGRSSLPMSCSGLWRCSAGRQPSVRRKPAARIASYDGRRWALLRSGWSAYSLRSSRPARRIVARSHLLGIRKDQIEKRQPWQSYIETHFNVQRRMADWHYGKAESWTDSAICRGV